MVKTVSSISVIANLQRQYDSIIGLPEKPFFLGVAAYVKYILEASSLNKVIKSITKRRAAVESKKLNDDELNFVREVKVWGAWEELLFLYCLVYRYQKEFNSIDLSHDPYGYEYSKAVRLRLGYEELKKIVTFYKGQRRILVQEKFIDYISRFHKNIVDLFNSPIIEDARYDSQSQTLNVFGKSIPIRGNDQKIVCSKLFGSRSGMLKEWSWDEVLNETNPSKDEWRRIYSAGREINSKVLQNTDIKDLLMVRTKTITVNPIYLQFRKKQKKSSS